MTIAVRPRASLVEPSGTTVFLGRAYDRLPLILQVERRASVEPAVLAALGYPPKDRLAPAVAEALTALEQAVGGIAALDGQRIYRTVRTVNALLGETLLAKTLGAESPLPLHEDQSLAAAAGRSRGEATTTPAPPDRVANTQALAALPAGDDAPLVLSVIMGSRRIAVPLNDGEPLVLSDIAGGDSQASPPRPLLFEDLRHLGDARFHYVLANGNRGEAPASELTTYEKMVREAQSIGWTVSRTDLADELVRLGRAAGDLHRSGRVHGDVKPGNVLLIEAGATPIDLVGTSVGEVSQALTPGWAAPEQVLARPVSPATDVFALGLMLASLAQGAVYGEERTFIVATGGRSRQRLQVLVGAGMFLDPRNLDLGEQGRRAWQEFLGRCIAFDPDQRPVNGETFANELEELLGKHELPGRLNVPAGPGHLMQEADLGGEAQPVWVVTDRW